MHDPNQTTPEPLFSEGGADVSAGGHPARIGRYLVKQTLGTGGFGVVYLAHDPQLQRLVAIKVPHRTLVSRPEDAEAYLTEARTVAGLDHPNIVTVYDADSTEDCPCFIVSKYIEGSDLKQRLKDSRFSVLEAVQLTATVAETLHYAHRQGLVHRDIKPGNILLDTHGKPFVADFGLALKEENLGQGPRFAGTPAYMSPEQARGEGHRVDGRSDIFSLGIVLYELLTDRRPFHAPTRSELLEQITNQEPRPLRQWDETISKELERICLKALAKRAADRYSTAKDFADDLRDFLGQSTELERLALRSSVPAAGRKSPAPASTPAFGPVATPGSDQVPVRIVPKGLRAFDAHDADFFLELLPGPRDRDGLPESIRFWKTRIEETDPDNTFAVGLIYGPSGCGKSSLVKAGLLPRLAGDVIVVHVEATAEETETRLLNGLRKRCPSLPPNVGLKEALAGLRQGQGLPAGRKVLIVLDQFEQWLHARKDDRSAELVEALRQCDGGRLQCLVMVRDDFWLAVSRFVRNLEIDLVPSRNIALVDVFDVDHARKVLASFGRAFGRLPENPGEISKEHKEFLTQAVSGLAREGKVICVRLALFAEMMKGKPWTPASLKEAGGAEGVGVTFLEDTFSSSTANPKHRLHQKAARAVLRALLPDSGSDMKGPMRSHAELLAASGYAGRPRDFDDLIRILDGELRLITPADLEGSASEPGASATGVASPVADAPGSDAPGSDGQRCYQLTHDYLVHSLRDWLTRKQKETRRGRAELRLMERAALWSGKPEKRFLPSLMEWMQIRLFTRSRPWTPPQRQMMRRADRYYLARSFALAAVMLFMGWGAWEYQGRMAARALRDRLLTAATTDVPKVLADMGPHRRWLDPLLREVKARSIDAKEQLHVSLALLRSDPDQASYLYERLYDVEPQVLPVVRAELLPFRDEWTPKLWAELANQAGDSERRLRAACALAEYAPDDPRWTEYAPFVIDKLVAEDALALKDWKTALEPVGRRLLPALAASLEDNKWGAVQRRTIIELYAGFAGGREDAFAPLETRLFGGEEAGATAVERAKRQANLAAALVALRRGERVWPLLVHTPTPTLRSYLIERLGSSGGDPTILKTRLEAEKEVSARRALILALGGFPPDRLPELVPVLVRLYEEDPDAGVHGASGWLLRKWKQEEQLRKIDQKLATGRVAGGRSWYVNKQRQTLSIIRGPQSLLASGAKEGQAGPHQFAVAATEVTVEQFLAFKKDHLADGMTAPTPDSPVNMVSWYDAAEYCNWLSKQDGIPESQWCYQRGKGGLLDFVPGYQKRTGYRLPTESEWEFACRADAKTPWCFGEADEELVGHYAFWLGNAHADGIQRSFPVGSLKPNDWGLFDMHGNVAEWCQESATPQLGTFRNDIECGGRGGCYFAAYSGVRSTSRFVIGRAMPFEHIGFRPARTLP